MANEEECRGALDQISQRLAEVDGDRLAEHIVERTISCRIPDLRIAYLTRLHAGGLDAFERTDAPADAQVKLTVRSDDLIALARDELSPAKAWASGKLKIEASIVDLLRLRKLL
jgi:predicted lipid carrier protein YhbT